jgi:hypothetical protein
VKRATVKAIAEIIARHVDVRRARIDDLDFVVGEINLGDNQSAI